MRPLIISTPAEVYWAIHFTVRSRDNLPTVRAEEILLHVNKLRLNC